MKRTTQEIAQFVNGVLHGNAQIVIESVASLKNAGPHDLTYADDRFHNEVNACSAGCILVRSGDFPNRTVIVVRSPKLAFAQAAAWILSEQESDPIIHPSAVVAADAVIGTNVRVGPGAVVEAGAQIGDFSSIDAGAYVGRSCRVGTHCTIYPRAVLYAGVTIGNRVIIHAGAVIGADGFGFVRDGEKYIKFPQVGTVVIEDDVEIGANTCVDRGSLETTRIRRGTKLDNLVQIAHNVEVGEHTVIAAQTGVSGSSTIGDHSVIGGQVGIGEHATLDSGTVIGGQGGVLNNKHVRGGKVLWGTPVRPLREFLEQQAHITRLPQLSKTVSRLYSLLEMGKKSDDKSP